MTEISASFVRQPKRSLSCERKPLNGNKNGENKGHIEFDALKTTRSVIRGLHVNFISRTCEQYIIGIRWSR